MSSTERTLSFIEKDWQKEGLFIWLLIFLPIAGFFVAALIYVAGRFLIFKICGDSNYKQRHVWKGSVTPRAIAADPHRSRASNMMVIHAAPSQQQQVGMFSRPSQQQVGSVFSSPSHQQFGMMGRPSEQFHQQPSQQFGINATPSQMMGTPQEALGMRMQQQQMIYEQQRQTLAAMLKQRQLQADQIRKITTAQLHYQKMMQKYLEEIRKAQGIALYKKFLLQLQLTQGSINQQKLMGMAQEQANQEIMNMASKKAENKQKILMDKLKDIDVNYEEVVDQAAAGKKSTKHGKRKGKEPPPKYEYEYYYDDKNASQAKPGTSNQGSVSNVLHAASNNKLGGSSAKFAVASGIKPGGNSIQPDIGGETYYNTGSKSKHRSKSSKERQETKRKEVRGEYEYYIYEQNYYSDEYQPETVFDQKGKSQAMGKRKPSGSKHYSSHRAGENLYTGLANQPGDYTPADYATSGAKGPTNLYEGLDGVPGVYASSGPQGPSNVYDGLGDKTMYETTGRANRNNLYGSAKPDNMYENTAKPDNLYENTYNKGGNMYDTAAARPHSDNQVSFGRQPENLYEAGGAAPGVYEPVNDGGNMYEDVYDKDKEKYYSSNNPTNYDSNNNGKKAKSVNDGGNMYEYDYDKDKEKYYSSNNPTNYDSNNKGKKAKSENDGGNMYEEVYDKEKDYSSNNPTNYDSTNKGKKAKIVNDGGNMYEYDYDKDKEKYYSSNNPTNYDSTHKGKKARLGKDSGKVSRSKPGKSAYDPEAADISTLYMGTEYQLKPRRGSAGKADKLINPNKPRGLVS